MTGDSLIVRALARRDGDDMLLRDKTGSITTVEALRFIDQFDECLRACRLDRDARVCVAMPNGHILAMTALAAMATTAFAPLDPRLTQDEYTAVFDDLEADGLVIIAGSVPAACSAARQRGIAVIEVAESGSLLVAQVASTPPGEHPPGHALLLHTSGTTSRPKLVGLSEQNILWSARSVATTLCLERSDRCLSVMPLFHIHGLIGVLLATVVSESSVELLERFDPFAFGRQLADPSVTWTSAVPSILRLGLTRTAPSRGVPLRFIRSGSAPLSSALCDQLERHFGCPVLNTYGMTEASHQMTSNPLPPKQRRPGTVGLPAGAEVALLNDGHIEDTRGVVGEVVVRGPGVIAQYISPVSANVDSHERGWFRTGDLGAIDADGYLTLHGRIKEIINVAGEKVSPFEVEQVLGLHPAVAEAVAFAAPDSVRGEQVCLAVVLDNDVEQPTATELRRFAAQRLATFKVPRRIVVLSTIPLGPTGKVQRARLAALLGLDKDAG